MLSARYIIDLNRGNVKIKILNYNQTKNPKVK